MQARDPASEPRRRQDLSAVGRPSFRTLMNNFAPPRHIRRGELATSQLTRSARSLAQRQARQLTVVRKRTQPTAVYVTRLTATATFAYLIALLVPFGTSRPVLAPLTALLVLQASLFQTIRSGIRKVVSVTAASSSRWRCRRSSASAGGCSGC